MKTFGILTLTYDKPLYNFFDDIKREYYIKKNIDYAFIYNTDVNKENTDRDVFYFANVVESQGIFTMFDKFIFTIKNFSKWQSYDYIIRANSSTFINVDKINEVIQKLPVENCYAGYHTYPGDQKDFVSGTCIVFSRDVIEKLSLILQDHSQYQREDDLIIFDYMNRFNILKTFIPMFWYDMNVMPSDHDLYMNMEKYPLLRIKNSDNRDTIDTYIWNLIKSKIL